MEVDSIVMTRKVNLKRRMTILMKARRKKRVGMTVTKSQNTHRKAIIAKRRKRKKILLLPLEEKRLVALRRIGSYLLRMRKI